MKNIFFDKSKFHIVKDIPKNSKGRREITLRKSFDIGVCAKDSHIATSEMIRRGTRTRTVTALGDDNKFVDVVFLKTRYQCPYCGAYATDVDTDFYPEGLKYSPRLTEYIANEMLVSDLSYEKIHDIYGVSKTVAKREIERQIEDFRKKHIVVTNVEKLYFLPLMHKGKKRMCVAGRVFEGGESIEVIFDFLNEYSATSIRGFIEKQLLNKETVETVAVELDGDIIELIKKLLPDAEVSVINDTLNEELRKTLDSRDDSYYEKRTKIRRLAKIIKETPDKESLLSIIGRWEETLSIEEKEKLEGLLTCVKTYPEEVILGAQAKEAIKDIQEIQEELKMMNRGNKSFELIQCATLISNDRIHYPVMKAVYSEDSFTITKHYVSGFYVRIA